MAPPKPIGKAKGALGKKAGPLPIWAWALVGGGALLVVFLFLRRNTEQAPAGVQLVTGNAQRAEDTVSGGYPQGVTPASQMLDSEVLWTIAGSLATISEGQTEQHSTLGDRLTDVKESVAQSVAGITLAQPAVTTPTAQAAGSAPKVQNQQPERYYTFKPGAAPKGRKADEAPRLKAGQRLQFRTGQGYYIVG